MSRPSKSGLRPGLCTVCHHAAVDAINQALLNGLPLRKLGKAYGLSPSALSRHNRHLRRAQAEELQRHEREQLNNFLDDLDLLRTRLDRLFRKSEDDRSLHISLGCLQETFKIMTLRARLSQNTNGRI